VGDFAGQSHPVDVHDPRGEQVASQTIMADAYGGVEGSYELPDDAPLGAYSITTRLGGHLAFRVEEYKKPEFEVLVEAPEKPVMLGEEVTATIKARYYFGSPVNNATVKYKVVRNNHSADWYPLAPWDWFYGRGYWWFAYDYPWYPGWERWVGCLRPIGWWWPHFHQQPPEVVAEQEVELGLDGTLTVNIDTAVAQAVHGNRDHQYTITAEVRDESRRTIVGEGRVLVARRPFKVYTWVDRGYYRVGDTVEAQFLAQTLDQKPVDGRGPVRLLKISYDEQRQPIETEVADWQIETGEDGRASLKLQASAQGQYRLACTLTDDQGHEIEGGYMFTVIGEGFDGAEYRFNSLELIPDKRDYAAGDTVKMQINTDRPGATVLLFVRPSEGVYLPPQVVSLKGKSTIVEIPIVKRDMPNIFVEALTLSDSQVHTQVKEIVVPPESRLLNVEVLPSRDEYKPGENANIRLRLTDWSGENFVGTLTATMYDKAVEYISGGSNVGDIREFFWKWRRSHHPQEQSSLQLYSSHIYKPNDPQMQPIGVFGHTVADELTADNKLLLGDRRSGQQGRDNAPMALAAAPGGMRGGPMGAATGVTMMRGEGPGFGGGGGFGGEGFAADVETTGAAAPELVAPTVRTNFADTALWVGTLATNDEGIAELEVDMPENLTTWKIRVWGLGQGTRVGESSAEVVTRKNLILRMQTPRFAVQKDEVILSANVHNYLTSDKQVQVSLELDGDELLPLSDLTSTVAVSANGETRVDWRVRVVREGLATIRMKALTDEESDAAQLTIPCHVHGLLKTESWAGTVHPDANRAAVNFQVPEERRPEQSRLEVRYSPTLAGAMVDALPYLLDYPYGCTEQTLNRFLPAVLTQKMLQDMRLDLAEIREKRSNLNAQEIGDDPTRAADWGRAVGEAVFDQQKMQDIVKTGVTRLTNMQSPDGGWGWFSGWQSQSGAHTTAVVVRGLLVAQQNDVPIVPDVIERGLQWLERYQAEQVQKLKNADGKIHPWKPHADDLDALVYHVLAEAERVHEEMRDFLYRDRIELSVYGKSLYALALHKQQQQDKLAMLRRNIDQYLVEDLENETAYLRLPNQSQWWYWYGDEIETQAAYLKLLSRMDPQNPVAGRLVKYLLNNRKHATYWKSTRDTAWCVEAFGDYIRASGEMQPDMVVEVWLDGEMQKEVTINSGNLFSFDNKLVVEGAALNAGGHQLELRRRGKGPVYFNVYVTNFTLEDFITRAGLEVRVQRKYYKLERDDKEVPVSGTRGQAVNQRVERYRRLPLENLSQVTSGDLLEIELEIESKNDYEYVMFEDWKAAGLEPVQVQSGYTANDLGAYMELRNDRVVFFVQQLARGRHSVSYRMRAEIPGQFSALPTQASAMYAPELRGNSDEIKLRISD
jgi:alpha-2-macroglobulin